MKKSLLRAALLAILPFCMMAGTVVTAPAAAAEKQEKPTISRSIGKQINAAQKAAQAKDWATVISESKKAQAAEDLTDYDKYVIDRFLAMAYLNLGDHASATTAIAAAVTSPAAPADERKMLMRPALALENEAGNYAKTIEIGKLAISDKVADDTVYGEMAIAAFNMKDFNKTIDYANKSIDLADAAGKTPVYAVYQVLSIAQDQLKDRPATIKTLQKMCLLYGKAADWRNLIDFSLASLPAGEKSLAALDIYRLGLTVGAKSTGPDYKAMADAANFVRSPGDVINALEAGIAKGALQAAQVSKALRKAKAEAKRDRPILPKAEAAAARHGSAKEDMNVAEAYFGYGKYAAVERVAQRAIKKGGKELAQAQMLLGMAQALLGKDAAASQTFASVTSDAALQRAAQLWNIYVTRKYGRTPAAAPAAAPANKPAGQ